MIILHQIKKIRRINWIEETAECHYTESTTSSTVAVKAFSLFLPIETRETEPITMDQNGRAQNHKVEDN